MGPGGNRLHGSTSSGRPSLIMAMRDHLGGPRFIDCDLMTGAVRVAPAWGVASPLT